MSKLISQIVLLAAAAAALSLHCATAEDLHNISLVVMAPFPGDLSQGWSRGPALIPAARVAAQEINNDSSILPGFHLNLVIADDGCSVTSKVTISFLKDIYTNKDHQVVGIIGPGCSGTAIRVSTFTRRNEVSLIHVTPSATSPNLEDPERNTTYATISSALSYVKSFVALMEYNSWGNIATLQDQARAYFKQTHSEFIRTIDTLNNSTKLVFTGSLFESKDESVIPLDSLRESRARVVMVFAGGGIAAQLLCYAYQEDMLYPNYQWIFHDRTMGQLIKNVSSFRVNGRIVNCSDKEMERATEGVILNQFHLTQVNQNETLELIQKTYLEYNEDYKKDLKAYIEELRANGITVDNESPIDYGNSYHDAVWAMALALHNAWKSGVDLRSYTYGRNNDTRVIAEQLKTVNFNGVSGPVAFQRSTRSSQTVINIKQLTNGMEKVIGTFDRSRETELKLIDPPNPFIDDVYEKKNVRIHIAVGILTILLALVLILFTAFLQAINTFWYNYHSIKATSPNITHLVFSGCYLFSIASLILSVQNTFTFSAKIQPVLYSVLCNTFTWCFILGYSLIFGTICTKIWRVYRLFKHFRNARPGHFLSDNSLVMFVTILLLVDVAICITWSFYDPWMIRIIETPSTRGVPTLFLTSDCQCNHVTAWVIVISLYKGTIMILLVALSIMNRRIKRKDFQHTRKINTLIYGITMLTGVGLPLYFLLKHFSIYIGFAVFNGILLSTVVLSGLTLFLPPVIPVLKMKITGEEEEPTNTTRVRRTGVSVKSNYYSTIDE